MAVAAYSAVVSLMHILDNIQHPARHQLHFDRNHMETLREKFSFLFDFLEDNSEQFCSTGKEDLARQIADVADEAEHVIDSHVVDQLSQKSADDADIRLSSFSEDIDKIIDKIESIKKELMIKDERAIQEQQPRFSLPASSSAPPSRGKNTIVGLDKHLARIVDQLTGDESDLQIVPIVGMGGIGKTTLAKSVFDSQYIVNHFDIRTWFTISQKYSVREILIGLVHGDRKNKESSESSAKLGEQLYKRLFGKRYLIVMDDVWSTEVWDELRSFFPDNRNGSRIIVTTRLSNLAVSLDSQNSYLMDFLDEDISWNLFCEKAFAQDICPPELEKIGKNIVKSCQGLPLAIVVIGGLLSNSSMTPEYWEFVAKNVNSFANSGDDKHCLNILSLSYSHLPIHLKPCFLYMRVFPEDCEIRVSQLIKSWVAEGFVKLKRGKTLEEVAQEYWKDLIDRNLILIHELAYSGKIKTCKIHDLLRDLCIREHEKEHFFRISKVQVADFINDGTCFLCTHRNVSTMIYLPAFVVASQPTSLASFSLCDVCRMICSQFDRLRLVRATYLCNPLDCFGVEFMQPTRLRYLDFGTRIQLVPTLLPLLWDLQTLIVDSSLASIDLPSEIWEMPQLRHLKIFKAIFRDPPATRIDKKDSIILENLQTLSYIKIFRCSEDILERIPNLKKLDIYYLDEDNNWPYYLLLNLAYLHKLESLSLNYYNINLDRKIAFPHSLKKLCLNGCNLPWEGMTIIGSLPNLEVLKLENYAFVPEWNMVEGEFLRLKSLSIYNTNLKYWNAEKYHFPKLEILVLEYMPSLEKIPSGVGEIETLRAIHLVGCTESAVKSAEEIIGEQRSFGNEDLQLHVEDYD